MRRIIFFMIIALFLPIFVAQVSGGTKLVINHAVFNPDNQTMTLSGAYFLSFGDLEVWVGDMCLNCSDPAVCTVNAESVECDLSGTPAVSTGGTWIVRVAACKAQHCKDEIHLAIFFTTVPCNSGDSVECYTGVQDTKGVGECNPGIRSCIEGSWEPNCSGETTPVDEICDDFLDNDCDNQLDCGDDDCFEDPACTVDCVDADSDGSYAISQACPEGDDCDDGDSNVHPGLSEICDGKDNNCINGIDEGFDLNTDPLNCGGCNNVCTDWPNGTEACVNAQCVIQSCDPGWGDCEPQSPGCETDISSDVLNCGACGAPCFDVPNAYDWCVNSQCTYTCDPGWEDCDGNPENGCEVDLTSPLNCGECGVECSILDSPPTCVSPSDCQGLGLVGICDSGQCVADTIQDDSACDSSIVADTCGYYPSVYCTGAVDQEYPVCSSTCGGNNDSLCDGDAHCDNDACMPDLATGRPCDENSDCISNNCVDGACA